MSTRRIEWPPRSGLFASYDPYEERCLRDLAGVCEAGQIDEKQLAREVEVLHEMKRLLDARIVGDPEDVLLVVEPFEPPDAGSPFQIPGRAVDLLAIADPQLRIAS